MRDLFMMLSRPKPVIHPRRPPRQVDLFGVILLFVTIGLPISLLYQVSVHYFGDHPAVAVVDLLRNGQP